MRKVNGKWERLELHHINQKVEGSVAEVWSSIHKKLPHNAPLPSWRKISPEAAEAWRKEVLSYWRWRTEGIKH